MLMGPFLSQYLLEELLPLALTAAFLGVVFYVIAFAPNMFFKRSRHGRYHALLGLLYLAWITMGLGALLFAAVLNGGNDNGNDSLPGSENSNVESLTTVTFPLPRHHWLVPDVTFDVILGIIGSVLTLSAAFEFKHKHVKNFASGTLDEHATVTYTEMMEHSFYQLLNVVQISFLHFFTYYRGLPFVARVLALYLATAPWLWRGLYPINRFSDNYKAIDAKSTPLIRILYRIKKYQYVFYKHFILHGLNITVAMLDLSIANAQSFRLFWLLLNLSYVMEFFLQTLVKKKRMRQSTMLHLQKVLMTAASLSAISILMTVNVPAALGSLFLNFTNRKHDVINTLIVAGVFACVTGQISELW